MITLWELPEGATFRFTENEADSIHTVLEHKRYADKKKMVRVLCMETYKLSNHLGETVVYEAIPEVYDPATDLDIEEEDEL